MPEGNAVAGITLLFIVFVLPFLLYIGFVLLLNPVAKAARRASRDREIERELRDQVADSEAERRAAVKILKERGAV